MGGLDPGLRATWSSRCTPPGLGLLHRRREETRRAKAIHHRPEMSPLFGQTLAQQAAEVAGIGPRSDPGNRRRLGRPRRALLAELERMHRLPRNYYILEVSPDLRPSASAICSRLRCRICLSA